MPHECLYLFGVVALLDPQGSAGVAQGVQAVFSDPCLHRRAGRIQGLFLSRHACLNLDRPETTVDQVGIGFDFPDAVRENQPKVTLGAE